MRELREAAGFPYVGTAESWCMHRAGRVQKLFYVLPDTGQSGPVCS